MTTNTAKVAEHGEKEKVEKRRALGRGLESLLPRVVSTFKGGRDTGSPGAGAKAADAQTSPSGSTSGSSVEALKGRTSAETASPVELRTVDPKATISGQNPHPSTSSGQAFSQNQGEVGHPTTAAAAANVAELRSGHPMAAVPTYPSPMSTAGTSAATATGSVDYDPFGEAPPDGVIEIQAVAEARVPSNLVVNLAISDIDKNPFQTRYVEDDEALEELAESIKANGVVQPIVVRPAEEAGRYVLILGERRLHASKKIQKTHIPALVRRVSEQLAAEMTIVENLQREDLSPLEQAQAFKVLSTQFNMTQDQIAQRVGLSRASIANYMRLLKLPREVMEMLAEKRINFAQAKELLKLGDNDRIAEAAIYAVKKGMNIEQIEMLVLRMDGLLDPLPDMPGVQKEKKSSGARWVDPNVRAAQMDMERMLGVRVRIRDRKGRGKIVIEYSTVDDYERVVGMLRGKK